MVEIRISDPRVADKFWQGRAVMNHAAHDGPAAARNANIRLLRESPTDAPAVLDGARAEELSPHGEDVIVDGASELLDGQP